MKISHKSSKKDRIAAEIADANLEITYLKMIYTKLAGINPSLNVLTALTKEQLLAAIAALTSPIPDSTTISSFLTKSEVTLNTLSNDMEILLTPSTDIFVIKCSNIPVLSSVNSVAKIAFNTRNYYVENIFAIGEQSASIEFQNDYGQIINGTIPELAEYFLKIPLTTDSALTEYIDIGFSGSANSTLQLYIFMRKL